MAAVGVLAAIVLVVSMVRTPAAVVGAAAPAPPPLAIADTSAPATPAPTTSAAPTRESVFIGHSSGNEMTVAVAVAGEEASAYICDGERIEAWLEGTVSGEQVNLQGRNGAQLTATLTDNAALGTVTVAEAGPPAGIYEGKATVDGKPNRIGWIVLPSGRQVGINNAAGNRGPAPALDPNDIGGLELAGAKVEVQRIDGGDPVVPR
jgi:hypothetical protein